MIYVGSFSKSFSPAVRLGFAVLPPSLTQPVAALRQLIDWHPPVVMQAALASFIEDGLLDKHLRRSRRAYTERRDQLTDALGGRLSRYLTAGLANAGLHVTTYLRPGLGEFAVQKAALKRGIGTMGLQEFYLAAPPRPGLLIGFSAVSTTTLPAALRELEEVLAAQAAR